MITDREELIFLLSEASELEHGLCCCYLFAAFSLKRNPDEGLTSTEREALTRWEPVIIGVGLVLGSRRGDVSCAEYDCDLLQSSADSVGDALALAEHLGFRPLPKSH